MFLITDIYYFCWDLQFCLSHYFSLAMAVTFIFLFFWCCIITTCSLISFVLLLISFVIYIYLFYHKYSLECSPSPVRFRVVKLLNTIDLKVIFPWLYCYDGLRNPINLSTITLIILLHYYYLFYLLITTHWDVPTDNSIHPMSHLNFVCSSFHCFSCGPMVLVLLLIRPCMMVFFVVTCHLFLMTIHFLCFFVLTSSSFWYHCYCLMIFSH